LLDFIHTRRLDSSRYPSRTYPPSQYLQSLLAKYVKTFVVVKVKFNGLVKQQYHN